MGMFIGIIRYVPRPDTRDPSRVQWCVICQKMPLMLMIRYAKISVVLALDKN